MYFSPCMALVINMLVSESEGLRISFECDWANCWQLAKTHNDVFLAMHGACYQYVGISTRAIKHFVWMWLSELLEVNKDSGVISNKKYVFNKMQNFAVNQFLVVSISHARCWRTVRRVQFSRGLSTCVCNCGSSHHVWELLSVCWIIVTPDDETRSFILILQISHARGCGNLRRVQLSTRTPDMRV